MGAYEIAFLQGNLHMTTILSQLTNLVRCQQFPFVEVPITHPRANQIWMLPEDKVLIPKDDLFLLQLRLADVGALDVKV